MPLTSLNFQTLTKHLKQREYGNTVAFTIWKITVRKCFQTWKKCVNLVRSQGSVNISL